ncbi:MAG: hypothetical protein R3F61_25195 [Myxococcota bacterium]
MDTDDSTPFDTDFEPERQWVEISTAPCARDSEGYVECWSDPRWEEIPGASMTFIEPAAVRVKEVSNGSRVLWGVDANTDLPIYFSSGLEPNLAPPLEGFSHLNTQCAIREEQVECWATSPSPFPSGAAYVAVHGERFSHAALTADNQLFVRYQTDPTATGYDFALDPAREVRKMVHVEPSDACVLDGDGIVECFGPSGYHFDNPPYVDLAAGLFAACAVRADWLIECRDGSTFDFGPIRDLEITQEPSYSLVDEGTPDERWFPNYTDPSTPPNICVITQDNAVRCEGWKYFETLQASLPQGGG